MNTVVVGAGISGLTVAWWLHRAGLPVTVLEAAGHPGGTMRTLRDGGWLVEQGPNSSLETTPLFAQMFEELGILPSRLYPDAAAEKRYILRSGQLHALPMSPPAFLRSRLWTTRGKLRLLREPFIGRADREESIAEFVERRLGREFLDYAINPFVAGVYAGSPEHLSVRAAFPKLYALEEKYGGLIRGMIGGRRERKARAEKAKDRARLFSFAEGMQTFPDAIARVLGPAIRFGTPVSGLRREGGKFVLETEREELRADVVVLSAPAHTAATLVRGLVPALSPLLERVYYPPVAEVFLGYEAAQAGRALDGFGFLVPALEKRKVLGTIWSSSLFPGRAPVGHVALTSFVGGARSPELAGGSDTALAEMTADELASVLGMRGAPVYTRVIRWERAIPQYTMGYHTLLEALDRAETGFPGLFFCSNYRGGIAVGDCVMSGERTASRIARMAGVLREEPHSATTSTR
jgi:oxygen-dependent protoporphyrinogen oxidase